MFRARACTNTIHVYVACTLDVELDVGIPLTVIDVGGRDLVASSFGIARSLVGSDLVEPRDTSAPVVHLLASAQKVDDLDDLGVVALEIEHDLVALQGGSRLTSEQSLLR